MIKNYLQNIFKTFKQGDATEQSYYPDLKKLFGEFLESKKKTANITVIPRRTKVGIPDFTVRKSKELVGFVEAKKLTIEDLSTIEHSEQIERYKKNLDNFILTNYFDFWLWRRSENNWIKKVCIGQPRILNELKIAPPPQNEKKLMELLEVFFSYNVPEKKTSKSLAQELARRAKLMPYYIIEELNNNETNEIDRIYDAFKKYLIPDLNKKDFADIYAQTITYGLFTARLQQNNQEKFDRFIASRYISKNIKILHKTFNLISSEALPESITWIVDDIATLLAHADIEKIKKELHTKKVGDDPIVHFYETFLAEYNPKTRKSKGVYYTPLPVVSYIVRSINTLLKEKFGKTEGLADRSVTILDPASGTLTFPVQAAKLAIEEYKERYGSGGVSALIKDHILKNFYAFELLMAPYIIGHLKIANLCENLGYKFKNKDRFQLYLTNTLSFSEIEQTALPFVSALSEESHEANKIKKDKPILVIMGNPPYSVSSSNAIKEESGFKNLYESYKEIVRKEEKNIQPLSDDYIKFIAFAHWKIKQIDQGVIGIITNNSYLDGIIHRDMRRKLSEDFDEIYILNLHGNSKRKEKTPEGGKDENVFDIQQGVSIILLIKKG